MTEKSSEGFTAAVGLRSQFPNRTRARNRTATAFSLIELIGVLAVVVIISAVLYPMVIQRIDTAAREREKTDLVAISNALVLNILTNRIVPHETNWTNAIANWAQVDTWKIAFNSRRNERRFVIDTGGWLGTALSGNNSWTQRNAGTIPVTNARIVVVSSVGRALPAISSRPAASDFTSLWNTLPNTKPSIWTGWTGRADDLVIQRISLDPLFHRLTLVNRDPVVSGSYYIQPATTPTNLPPSTLRTASYLNGTDISLLLPTGPVQERHLLTQDASYAFGGSRWGGDYLGPGSTEEVADGFAYWAFRFMKAGSSATAQQGANPEGGVAAMYNFMLVFSLWGNKCVNGRHFPLYGENDGSGTVPEYMLLNDLAGGGPNNLGSFLGEFTGPNGLLKYP